MSTFDDWCQLLPVLLSVVCYSPLSFPTSKPKKKPKTDQQNDSTLLLLVVSPFYVTRSLFLPTYLHYLLSIPKLNLTYYHHTS